MIVQVLRELWEIIEYKDNSIYRTRYVEDVWVDPNEEPPAGFQYVVKSSDYEGEVIRRIDDDLEAYLIEKRIDREDSGMAGTG